MVNSPPIIFATFLKSDFGSLKVCTQSVLDERENVELLKHFCSFPNVFFIQKKTTLPAASTKKVSKNCLNWN